MIYDLKNDYDLQRFNERVSKLEEKKSVVDLTEKKPQRTTPQNSYLHLLIGFYASEFGYTKDEVKVRFFKETCNADIFKEKKQNKRGNVITALRSSRSLTTEELSIAIERFRNWSASECGFYLPSADDYQYQMFAQQQIDRAKEFI